MQVRSIKDQTLWLVGSLNRTFDKLAGTSFSSFLHGLSQNSPSQTATTRGMPDDVALINIHEIDVLVCLP